MKYFVIFCILILVFMGGLLLAEALTKENEVSASSWDTLGYYHCVYIVIEVPAEQEDWESAEELGAFVDNWVEHREVELLAGRDGKIQFSGQCSAFALSLRDAAMRAGKHIEVVVLPAEEYNKRFTKKLKLGTYHTLGMALIGYEHWLIEPQTGEKHKAYYIP